MNWKSTALAFSLVLAVRSYCGEKPRLVITVPCEHLTERECQRAEKMADWFVPAITDTTVARGMFDVAPQCRTAGDSQAVRSCYFDALLEVGAKGLGDRLPERADAWLLLVFTAGEGVDGSLHGAAYLVPRADSWAESQFSLRPLTVAGEAHSRWLVDAGALPKHLADQKLARSVRARGKFPVDGSSALFGHALLIEK